jgi:pimeloyl-ACP methyl ester carboxylesterase
VVSRGGRPDLAPQALPQVACPTLFIVGARDFDVLQLNRQAAAQLIAPHALQVVPGATHLFEEPGTLEQAAHLARDWFLQHLAMPSATAPPW